MPAATRRDLLAGTLAGIVSGAGVAWPRASRAAGGLEVHPVADGVRVVEGAGGNVVVVDTQAGRILVDSGAEQYRAALLATLDELPGGPVAALFNTHWHTDQTGSNATFGETGAAIFAHEKTRQRLASGYYLRDEDRYRPPAPPAALPTETIYTTGSFGHGGQTVDYGHLIAAHTDGDIYVHFLEPNVMALGDALSPARDPVFDWFGGGWLGGRVDGLAAILARTDANTRFVPAYGPVVGRAEVQSEHDLMLELFERMVEHVRLGETAEDMLTTGVLDGLERRFADPARLLYDLHKGFWAHHNKLMPDIV